DDALVFQSARDELRRLHRAHERRGHDGIGDVTFVAQAVAHLARDRPPLVRQPAVFVGAAPVDRVGMADEENLHDGLRYPFRMGFVLLVFLAVATRVFVHEVPDAKTYESYSRTLGSDRYGKFVIDLASDQIFYFDVNVYRLHSDFVFHEFYHRAMKNEDINEFNRNYNADKPKFIFGYLTHHLKTDQWTYSFWEDDEIRPADIRRVRAKLNQTFFQKGIAWRPDSPMQEKKLAELGDIPTLTNDKIYKSSPYQSFNNGPPSANCPV